MRLWIIEYFGQLSATEAVRFVIPSVAILFTYQAVSGAFFISVLEIQATHLAAVEPTDSASARAA
jgi:hypothetical protein